MRYRVLAVVTTIAALVAVAAAVPASAAPHAKNGLIIV
jgi:hypothetical protein